MRKLITFNLLLLVTLYGYSQTSPVDVVFNINAGVAISDVEQDFASHHNYNVKSLYQNHVSFIELTMSSAKNQAKDTSFYRVSSSLTFKYFYPVYSNDSLRTKYSGNLFGFDLLGVNVLHKVKMVDLIFTGGINMGSKKVRLDNIKYKNFIFAPKLTGELRFNLGNKFVISARAEQQFDLSKPIWKLKSGVDILSNREMKYSPLMISAGIGWRLM